MKYAIAEHFPIEARRYAVGLEYVPTLHKQWRPRAGGSTYEVCPLGACFQAMGKKNYGGVPNEDETADYLGYSPSDDDWSVVTHDALEFISAWDHGRITDLAEALGVEP